MSFTKAAGILAAADKTHCPVCGHYQYPNHQSGTGCVWCDHTNVCGTCRDAEAAKGSKR